MSLDVSAPTPTLRDQEMRAGGFQTLVAAVDYAGEFETGFNIYSRSGALVESLSYRRLRAEAVRGAHRFVASGYLPGDRIGITASTDVEFISSFFAAQYAGLVPVPLPLPTPFTSVETYKSHLSRMAESADLAAAFVTRSVMPAIARHGDFRGPVPLTSLDELPAAGPTDLPKPDPESVAYLQFSSGSTRFPVGVAVTHRAINENCTAIIRHGLQIVPDDRAVSWLPLYHDMGLVGFVIVPLACQGSADLIPTSAFVQRPSIWMTILSANRATISYSPTFGYDLVRQRAEQIDADVDLSSWRVAGIGGDMINARLIKAFAETFARMGFNRSAVTASYGMAEASLGLSMTIGQGLQTEAVDADLLEQNTICVAVPGATKRQKELVKCGKVLPGFELQIRDARGRVLGDREVGKIVVRGHSLMAGYYNQREATAAVLTDDGWFDTGDLGYLDDGDVVVTGRSKDLIIVKGRNLWPQDMEAELEEVSDELRRGDVAAFAIGDDQDTRIVVLIHSRSRDTQRQQQIVEAATKRLRMSFGVEARIVLVPPKTIPHTSSGKLSRARAKQMFENGQIDPLMQNQLANVDAIAG
jgi:fatty-acyl-CoA synthase